MKKLLMTLMILLLCLCALPAMAEAAMAEISMPEPMTWAYLGTIAGCATFAMIVAQVFKMPLDKLWHIPTRLLVYAICLVTMLTANAMTAGLTVDTALLAVCNAFIAALTAYGMYELSFAKRDRAKKEPPDPDSVPYEPEDDELTYME